MKHLTCQRCGLTGAGVVETTAYVDRVCHVRRVCCEQFGCLARRVAQLAGQQNGPTVETGRAVA